MSYRGVAVHAGMPKMYGGRREGQEAQDASFLVQVC